MLVLHLIQAEEIKLEGLNNGPGVLPFKLGPMRLTTHYHTFLQYIELKDINDKISSVRIQLVEIKEILDNYTYALYELQIDHLTNKLDKASLQLYSLGPSRPKRGLIDGLGSVVKSITGNLDYTDAMRYNDAIKTLKDNQDRIISEQNHHISLSKDWMGHHTEIVTKIVENQSQINNTLHDLLDKQKYAQHSLLKFAKFAQILGIVSDNVDKLLDELHRIEDAIAFSRAASTHHSMITLEIMTSMLGKLSSIYDKDQLLDIEIREYYDVIKPGSFYNGQHIVLVFQFPILSPLKYILYRLAIVPNESKQVVIPPYPFIAITRNFHVYIEAECPKLTEQYLCEEKLNHQLRSQPDCIQRIIDGKTTDDSCTKTTVSLSREAMEKLDDRHYVVVFPQPTKLQLTCERDEHNTLTGSFLVTIPHNCLLRTHEFTIVNINDRVNGQPMKITEITTKMHEDHEPQPPLKINSINLRNLHNLQDEINLQTPVQLESLESSSSFYHTTIPFYVMLSGALVLTIIVLCYRYNAWKLKPPTEQSPNTAAANRDHPYEEPETSRRQRETQMPATFSLNVLK